MASGILIVESQPSSPETAADYHKWYDEAHIPEILAVEGFVSTRRLESTDDGSFIAVYEIDTDVETAKANLKAAQTSGTMTRPVGMRFDPPPSVRYFRLINETTA